MDYRNRNELYDQNMHVVTQAQEARTAKLYPKLDEAVTKIVDAYWAGELQCRVPGVDWRAQNSYAKKYVSQQLAKQNIPDRDYELTTDMKSAFSMPVSVVRFHRHEESEEDYSYDSDYY